MKPRFIIWLRHPLPMTTSANYQVRAVSRALNVLACFSPSSPELNLTAISERVGLPKSTVFRLLAAMEAERFVERSEDGERYRVGVNAFKVGSAYLAQLSLERAARPFMEALVERLNLSANLGILAQHEVLYMAIVEASSVLRYASAVGQRQDIHCSALGKVLAAELPLTRVRAILAQTGMPRKTDKTITDPDMFLAQLETVRAQGYAVDEEESGIGVKCLAAPVRDHHGEVVCALSVSGPSTFYQPEQMAGIIEAVQQTAQAISERLGHMPEIGSWKQ